MGSDIATDNRPPPGGRATPEPVSKTKPPPCLGSGRAPVPPRRVREGLMFQPREMVLGRSAQQPHSGQADPGTTPGSVANFANDRKSGGGCPNVEQCVVSGKT